MAVVCFFSKPLSTNPKTSTDKEWFRDISNLERRLWGDLDQNVYIALPQKKFAKPFTKMKTAVRCYDFKYLSDGQAEEGEDVLSINSPFLMMRSPSFFNVFYFLKCANVFCGTPCHWM